MNLSCTLRTLLAGVLFGCLSSTASAQLNKCIDAAGKTSYQSEPCPAATRSAPIDLRGLSAVPSMPGDVSPANARSAIQSSCMGSVARHGAANGHRGKAQDFCTCVADTVMSDFASMKSMAARNDRAGLHRMGERAGLACAGRLR